MMNELKKMIETGNLQETENGALAYSTSGHKLLDMNFKVASYRSMIDADVIRDFKDVMAEDEVMAAKWMMFLRDIRGGLGERRSFRLCLKTFLELHAFSNPNALPAFLHIIPEYGRWDDLIWIYDNIDEKYVKNIGEKYVKVTIMLIIKDQLSEDIIRMKKGESISLLAKWMPRINTSSENTKRVARNIAKHFGWSEKTYRKTISSLNKYIDTVEVKMSANDWDINYEKVPSKANILYKDAFYRHNPKGRQLYLDKLEKGEATINSSTAFPHDIIHNYLNGSCNKIFKEYDRTLEAMWHDLPNFVQGDDTTLVVCDSSGSMNVTVGNGSLTAREVAYSLAIYFAERAKGEFKDNFISFSENPKFIDISGCNSLKDKFNKAVSNSEVANTNIERTMMLILNTAIKNKIPQEDMPNNVLIISDMEFDQATDCYLDDSGYPTKSLFDGIAEAYKTMGYKVPRLVFWNVNSRTNGIPIQENELGVALVSGFSPSICQMVLSSEVDPWKCLVDMLDAPRYKVIENYI